MKRLFRNIGRAIAGIIFLPATIFMIVFGNFTLALVPALAKPDSIKAGLANNEVYEDLLPDILPVLLESDAELEAELPIAFREIRNNMSDDDWRAVANELVPPAYIQEQLESVLDGIYDYMMGAPTIAYQLDLQSLSQRLSGEPGQRAITRIITLSTPCTAEQIDTIRSLDTPLAEGASLPACTPANERDRETLAFAYELAFKELTRFFQEEGTAMGELSLGEMTIAESVSASGNGELTLDIDTGNTELLELRVFFQTYQLYQPIFYLIPAGLFSLVVLFGVHSLKGFVRWSSVTLLLSGVAMLLAMLAFSVGIIRVPNTSPPPDWTLPAEVVDLVDEVVSGILFAAFDEIGPQLFSASAGAFLAGTILLIISFVLRGPKAVIRLQDTTETNAIPSGV